MTNLIVKAVDDALVDVLRKGNGTLCVNTEAERRQILIRALSRPKRRSLQEALASIPNVGIDTDFERTQSGGFSPVFD
jgi:plasmid stability protein